MKIVILSIVLALASCGSSLDVDGEESIDQAKSNSVQERYAELKRSANSGGPDDKLVAFIFVYEHLAELRDNAPEALQFLADAAAGGNVEAQYNFGLLMQTGTLVKQDEEQALPWLLLAAQKDNVPAQVWAGINLMSRYYESLETERQSYFRNSERWLTQARSNSKPGDAEWFVATEAMGRLYLGEDCTRDRGIELLEQASTAGFQPATRTLAQFSDLIEEWNKSAKDVSSTCWN
ncbi:MAG: tetratricopeptide repeat protein [Woeseia sp.]